MQVATDLKGRTQSLAKNFTARSRELTDKTETAFHNLELTFWRNVKNLCEESRTVPVKLNELITKVETRAESALAAENLAATPDNGALRSDAGTMPANISPPP
jgi:hypothetical protein